MKTAATPRSAGSRSIPTRRRSSALARSPNNLTVPPCLRFVRLLFVLPQRDPILRSSMLGSLPISDTTSMPNDRVRRPDTSLEWHDPQESSRRPAPNRPVVAQQAGPLSYLQQSYATPGSIRRPATVAPISQQPIRTAQWQDPFPSAWDAPQPSCASVPGQTLSSDSTARDPSGAGAPLYDPGQSAPGQRGRMATSERDPVRASAFSPKPPRASILAEHAEYIDQSSALSLIHI